MNGPRSSKARGRAALAARAALVVIAGLAACDAPPPDVPPEAPLADEGPRDLTWLHIVVDSVILPLMDEHDVPGIAVAVTVDGHALFYNYGVASRESGVPVDEATLFELGSVSKTITGTLAAYAQALDRLSLDDPPSRHLPRLAGSAIDGATLLHLGTYTAGGLPLQVPGGVGDDEAMIEWLRRWRPVAEPGARRVYSNPSIGLLGRAAALALGGDFSDLVERRILPELGMSRSYIHVPESEMDRYAWGYNATNRPVRSNPGVFDAEAYGVKSSTADMIRFVQANIDPSGLAEPVRRAVEGTQVGYFRIGEMVQGLGWEQYPYPIEVKRILADIERARSPEHDAASPIMPPRPPAGPTLFHKTGSTGGFGTYAAFVPEHRIGIVILANRNVPIPARIKAAHTILNRAAP